MRLSRGNRYHPTEARRKSSCIRGLPGGHFLPRVKEHFCNAGLTLEGYKDLLAKVEELPGVEFGKNGRPRFVAGPYDDVESILKQLEVKVGPGNFDYIVPAGSLEAEGRQL